MDKRDIGSKTFYKQRSNNRRYYGAYKIENADLSNENIVKTIKLKTRFLK